MKCDMFLSFDLVLSRVSMVSAFSLLMFIKDSRLTEMILSPTRRWPSWNIQIIFLSSKPPSLLMTPSFFSPFPHFFQSLTPSLSFTHTHTYTHTHTHTHATNMQANLVCIWVLHDIVNCNAARAFTYCYAQPCAFRDGDGRDVRRKRRTGERGRWYGLPVSRWLAKQERIIIIII